MSVYPWDVLGEEEYVFDFQPLNQFQYPGFFIQIVNKDLQVEYPSKRHANFPVPDATMPLLQAKHKSLLQNGASGLQYVVSL